MAVSQWDQATEVTGRAPQAQYRPETRRLPDEGVASLEHKFDMGATVG